MTHRIASTQAGEIGFLSNASGFQEEAVMLLHGIGAPADFFLPLMNLIGDRPVLAWEAPGYGASTPLGMEAPEQRDYAASLASLLRALGLKRIRLVGHSWGTLIAAEFAKLFPEFVVSLVLISPPSGYGALPESERNAVVEGRLGKLEELGAAALGRAMAPALLAPTATPALVEDVARFGEKLDRGGIAQATRMMGTADIKKSLASYPKPFLIVAGRDDQVTPPAMIEQIAASNANAALTWIADCGHLGPLEQTKETAATLHSFWRRHSS